MLLHMCTMCGQSYPKSPRASGAGAGEAGGTSGVRSAAPVLDPVVVEPSADVLDKGGFADQPALSAR